MGEHLSLGVLQREEMLSMRSRGFLGQDRRPLGQVRRWDVLAGCVVFGGVNRGEISRWTMEAGDARRSAGTHVVALNTVELGELAIPSPSSVNFDCLYPYTPGILQQNSPSADYPYGRPYRSRHDPTNPVRRCENPRPSLSTSHPPVPIRRRRPPNRTHSLTTAHSQCPFTLLLLVSHPSPMSTPLPGRRRLLATP